MAQASKTVKAFAALQAGQTVSHWEFPAPELTPHMIAVDVTHCGICHSDIHMMGDEWRGDTGGSPTTFPLVPGHEVIGTVSALGSAVTGFKVGQRVGFGAQGSSCHECALCAKGHEHNCTKFGGLYDPNHGGYAAHIRADSRFCFAIPDEIPSAHVAPLMCAGVTVFTPLATHLLPPGSRVGIVGIGGLGHLALQFANKMGYHVTAISTSPSKEAEARSLGAHAFLNSSDAAQMKAHGNAFPLIIYTASGNIDWNAYMGLVAPEGKFVVCGLPEAKIQVSPMYLIGGSKTIVGSLVGGTKAIKEMLAFSALHGVRPMIEEVEVGHGADADKVNAALTRVRENKARYRCVMKYRV
ncbi:zinc-containing alcohol dehydrogenase [Capsaspora owczarzaki ATCC 30864]|uniref:Zinc-containing alcohol dehydrogenase n=1 Tax=Capsaspora owczarzaki (strain ATCC 30864) TaxID=595528 RepID=A0A0D2VYM0_CAPO3|nr:zinc-containing alcohol dehydrogenase [Capsaspora owczarzaki ATCC 30864]KJE96832.1 zinc-containing alcohol dehydrogenase [Capsaspora owczarzaki ATCC 30864]|eukprot:XP_004343818.1 zinc-containing alcohol dehydrogenase [Capsaspora owczarzaki ATCC 30864]